MIACTSYSFKHRTENCHVTLHVPKNKKYAVVAVTRGDAKFVGRTEMTREGGAQLLRHMRTDIGKANSQYTGKAVLLK